MRGYGNDSLDNNMVLSHLEDDKSSSAVLHHSIAHHISVHTMCFALHHVNRYNVGSLILMRRALHLLR